MDARFDAFAEWFEVIGWIGLVFIGLAVVETVWDFATRRRRGIAETGANVLIALGYEVSNRVAFGLVFVIGLFLVEPLAAFEIPINAWTWVLAIVVADFSYYWMHRFEHETRLLWAYHVVHHSSPEFNLTTAYRLSWVEGAFEWIFFVPMILIGFDPVQTTIAAVVGLTYQTWIHTQKIGKLGWLDRIFNTPSVHRVHHGANDGYLDRNYGGILIIWDRMFGTYQAEEEPVRFGITEPVGSANPLVINFHEYAAIARDCWRSRRLADLRGYVFGPPGWRPQRPAAE